MKKTPLFVASAIGLTLVLYMAAYYLLPGDPPTAGMVGLFAAVALFIVWAVSAVWSRKAVAKSKPQTPIVPLFALWVGAGLIGLYSRTQLVIAQVPLSSSAPSISCSASPSTVLPGDSATITAVATSPQNRPLTYDYSATVGQISGATSTATLSTAGAPPGAITITCNVADDQGRTASTTTTVYLAAPAPPPLPAPQQANRVTGTAVLLRGEHEPTDYGLYSYALLAHTPSATELQRYRVFLLELVRLPPASDLSQYAPHNRINLTLIPLRNKDPNWDREPEDMKVDFILSNYDWARSAAIRATLTRPAAGPLIVSVLHPLDLETRPHPVLVQDFTKAQTDLIGLYMQEFVREGGEEQFWNQAGTLPAFQVQLKNALETSAAALNMSKTAVQGWIKLLS